MRYNDRRAVWHANIGPIRTPQLLAVHDGLAEIVESNRHDGDKAKPAALVDAYPGLGKSTAVREYGTADDGRRGPAGPADRPEERAAVVDDRMARGNGA